ncbi:Ferrichrome-iron receptor [Candidatus Burkholderia humilis]|nr:Ferrichrome-iron receptor [Candidatus Burkholderia humilis]
MRVRKHNNARLERETAYAASSIVRDLRKCQLAIAALVLFSAGAHAQSDQANQQQLKPMIVTGEREQETATSPVDGYVAKRSVTGTKTDTPIIENPQSISVITSDQMQAQGVQTVGKALRYTPGVIGETFGGLDQTVDYYNVRGFQNTFPFVDGLST